MQDSQLQPIGRFEKVLLATDGSEFSAGAERVAIGMCARGKGRLSIMTAVLASPEMDGSGGAAVEAAEAKASAVLDAAGARAAESGAESTKVIRYGDDPYREIVAESEAANVDVIVVGRRGKRGLARLMLGDATAKVIGDARCSVMVVPKAAGMWGTRVVLATDGSRSGDAAAVAAARLAKAGGLPVTVVSAKVPSHSPARQAEADAVVARVVESYRADGLEAEGVVGSGDPHHVILDTVRDRGADLIVMGTHGRTGLGRLLLGSNSERVIGHATCPVLVVKGT